MSEARPVFSISQITTLAAGFAEDLAAYRGAGLDGIGIWEMKLPEADDGAAVAQLQASGLVPTNAVPAVPSILPLQLMAGPAAPLDRVDAICASVARLARFDPASIVFLTGSGIGLDGAREIVVEGLKRIAEAAANAGVRVGLEPHQRVDGESWTIINSIAEAVELLDEADTPNLGITFDVWHLWNSSTVLEDIRKHVDRITGVHVADYRDPTRGWADRVLPGEGVADVPRVLAALDEAGWAGPYDLEIFSDNGTFGAAYPDSLWDVPAHELAARGRAALETVWAAAKKHQEASLATRGQVVRAIGNGG
jgi:sugar phosphate isomerase/epimerase